MKKAFLLSITLSVITLAAVFVFSHTKSADDEVLKANIEALAGIDPYYLSVSKSLDGTDPPSMKITWGDGMTCPEEFGRHNGVTYCYMPGGDGGGGNL